MGAIAKQFMLPLLPGYFDTKTGQQELIHRQYLTSQNVLCVPRCIHEAHSVRVLYSIIV